MAKKRVHEIAKEQGLTSKELLAKLNAAGIEAKAAASSVEESVALEVLGNGAGTAAAEPTAEVKGSGAAKEDAEEQEPKKPPAEGANRAEERAGPAAGAVNRPASRPADTCRRAMSSAFRLRSHPSMPRRRSSRAPCAPAAGE